MPQAQVMMRSWRSAIKVHRTAAQYIFKLHTSGMERCMQTCFLHTRLSAMSLVAVRAPTHMQCYRTQQGSHQHPPGHAAAGNVVADVLQVRHLSFVFAHAQWRVDTRAALVGVLYQGAAIRCAAANLV